jgi:hypothetical protein
LPGGPDVNPDGFSTCLPAGPWRNTSARSGQRFYDRTGWAMSSRIRAMTWVGVELDVGHEGLDGRGRPCRI